MAYTIDQSKLEAILTVFRKDPKNNEALVEFWELLKPIINLTIQRFPQHMSEDMGQEIRIFLMKRAQYLANAYYDGRIKNCTSYMFRLCYNAGINYYKKEAKTEDHLMPLDDLKMEPLFVTRNARKDKIINEVREEVQQFIHMHFKNTAQRTTAERFLVAMLNGQRPSMNTNKVERFAHSERKPAKDTFSIVQIKVREVIFERIGELLDQDSD